MSGRDRLKLDLPPEVTSARAARSALAASLDRWNCDAAEDAVLVLSELVTNALTHARSAPHVLVTHSNGTIRIEVRDTDHSIPAIRPPDGRLGGYGLRIVDRVSEAWGWEQTSTGKATWAIVDCHC